MENDGTYKSAAKLWFVIEKNAINVSWVDNLIFYSKMDEWIDEDIWDLNG